MLEQILVVLLFVMLAAITGGVAYITWVDFRDRRRRAAPKAPQASPPARRRKAKR
ncbi:hypothetical protein [Gloeobacter violaceus]|uniref:Gsl3699 protein n=1 Tax=Gloeobacter violaceus (strain ATCC 29082 / PCC 7421) TaxID=251221 RepID=Q7NF28_GLOVI|nr:hypothetical protein [Gloeobacter violaceus]BAC91640.1 gsl3699 [Gloeobacter violaceus PCC 7421]